MTLSLSVYDPRAGSFGSVICSSSPAVAARCQWVKAEAGVVCTQNVTNPVLAMLALASLADGASAETALAAALAADAGAAYRQLVVVGTGRPAVHTGRHALGIHAVSLGEHEAAAGNMLASASVIAALHTGYLGSRARPLEERLLDGLDQALAAGGEASPVRSAGLVVLEDLTWPSTDLRVDWDDQPAASLRAAWDVWQPVKADYRVRALDPAQAPLFGA